MKKISGAHLWYSSLGVGGGICIVRLAKLKMAGGLGFVSSCSSTRKTPVTILIAEGIFKKTTVLFFCRLNWLNRPLPTKSDFSFHTS